MTKQHNPSIVFFGSGPVAAKSLQLLSADFCIEAVITKPATLKEMQRVCPGVPVYIVGNRGELDSCIANQSFESNLAILVDFGIIVSAAVINAFSLGIVNSHFSLLPQWRGADPITFAILSGQATTGVSLMLLVEAMDEGPLLAQSAYEVAPDATTPTLTEALTYLSYHMLKEVVPRYIKGDVEARPQEASMLGIQNTSYSRRLNKDDGKIDWKKSAVDLEREVRAFLEWPKSRTDLGRQEVIITKAKLYEAEGTAGQVMVDGKKLLVYCGKDALQILRLKPVGKPEMDAEAFLAGYRHVLA